jgi:hypothetical protein
MVEEKQKKTKVKTILERKLVKDFIWPFLVVVLVFLFLVFESSLLNSMGMVSFNHVNLLLALGLIFLVKGAVVALGPSISEILHRKEVIPNKIELDENSAMVAFVWIMQGFVFAMVALFSEIIAETHVMIVGSMFSWLVVLLVVWEAVMIVSTYNTFSRLRLV